MAVFTSAMVVNGVYGGEYRSYIYVLGVTAVIAFFTMTFRRWTEMRKDIQDAESSDLREFQQEVKILVFGRLEETVETLQTADIQAS